MTGAFLTFSVKFREHIPTGKWNERKYIIAEFIANCWDGNTPEVIEDVDWDDCSDPPEHRDVSLGYPFEDDGSNIFFLGTTGDDDTPWYGSIKIMKEGMKRNFPDIDYEFHFFTADSGDVVDEVTIVDDGKEYAGVYHMAYLCVLLDENDWIYDNDIIDEDEAMPTTREEVLALDAFKYPEATAENPHTIPKWVLVDEAEEEEDEYPPRPKWFFL